MKSRQNRNQVTRKARIESLENREFLDAASLLTTTSPVAEIANLNLETNDIVDLADFSNAVVENGATFTPAETTKAYKMKWNAIDGADSYNVKISRDNGKTWITYAKPTEPECVTDGLYLGQTYLFRVFGMKHVKSTDANGAEVTKVRYMMETQLDASFTPTEHFLGRTDANFAATDVDRQYTMNFTKVKNAASYRVLIKRDGDDRWLQYRKSSEIQEIVESEDLSQIGMMTCTVNGLYAGKSYMFKIVATTADGRQTLTNGERYTAFSPIGLTASTTGYAAGFETSVQLVGADNDFAAAADFEVYSVTPSGHVKLKVNGHYNHNSKRYAFVVDSANHPIKVVANGVGHSKNSTAEKTFYPTGDKLDLKVSSPYDTTNRQFYLDWNIVNGAERYVVQRMNDNGQWVKVKEINRDATGYLATENRINMLNVGESKNYRVLAFDATGAVLDTAHIAYAPFGAQIYINDGSANAVEKMENAYKLNDVLAVNITGIDKSEIVSYQWSCSKNLGATWVDLAATEEYKAVKLGNINPQSKNYQYRCIVTAADGRQAVATAFAYITKDPANFVATVTENVNASGKVTYPLTMTFTEHWGGVKGFQFQYKANGVWINLANVSVSNGKSGYVATHPNSLGVVQDAPIRMRAVFGRGSATLEEDSEIIGASHWTTPVVPTLVNSNALLDDAFASLFFDE